MRKVLEQPGSHDVGGHLGEDPSLLVPPPLLVQLLILSPRAGRGHTGVQSVSLVTGVVPTLRGQAPAGWTWGPQMYRPAVFMVSNPRSILVWEAGAGGRVVVEVLSAAAVPILDDQVDGHLPLEAGDVAVTEVVAQVVDLLQLQ